MWMRDPGKNGYFLCGTRKTVRQGRCWSGHHGAYDELRTIRDQAVDSTQKYSAALIRLRRTAASAAFGLPFFVRFSPFTG